MEFYCLPGAYSFKDQIGFFLAYLKEQIDSLLNIIEESESKE